MSVCIHLGEGAAGDTFFTHCQNQLLRPGGWTCHIWVPPKEDECCHWILGKVHPRCRPTYPVSPIYATQETECIFNSTHRPATLDAVWTRSTKPCLAMMLCHQGSTCPELECSTTKALMSYLQTHLPTGSHSVGTSIELWPLSLLPYSSVAGT